MNKEEKHLKTRKRLHALEVEAKDFQEYYAAQILAVQASCEHDYKWSYDPAGDGGCYICRVCSKETFNLPN